jgi:hypothetical protein
MIESQVGVVFMERHSGTTLNSTFTCWRFLCPGRIQINMAEADDAEEAAKQARAIEIWKIKKLIKSLQLARGYVVVSSLCDFSAADKSNYNLVDTFHSDAAGILLSRLQFQTYSGPHNRS